MEDRAQELVWLFSVGLTVAASGVFALLIRKRRPRWLAPPGLLVVGVCVAAALSVRLSGAGLALVLTPVVLVAGFAAGVAFSWARIQRPTAQLISLLRR